MEDGVTGFVVQNLDEAVQAVGRISTLDRRECRRVFDKRFSGRRMAADYLTIYQRLVDAKNFRTNGDGQAKGRRLIGSEAGAKVVADI